MKNPKIKNFIKRLNFDDFTEECKEIVKDYICQLCEGVYYIPVLDNCEPGHIYCNDCIMIEKKCPLTKKKIEISRLTKVTFIHNIIQKQNIFCINKNCEWVGNERNRDTHMIDCGKALLKCDNKNCEVIFERENKHEHLSKCPFTKIKCNKCEMEIYNSEKEKHSETCFMEEIECTRKCGLYIQRLHMTDHTNKLCDFLNVNCEYNKFGCEFKCLKKDLINHLLEDTEKHSFMMLTSLIEMKTDFTSRIEKLYENSILINYKINDFISKKNESTENDSYKKDSSKNIKEEKLNSAEINKNFPIVLSSDSSLQDNDYKYEIEEDEYMYLFPSINLNDKKILRWKIYIQELKEESIFYTGICIKEIIIKAEYMPLQTLTVKQHGLFGISSDGFQYHNVLSNKNNIRIDSFPTVKKGDNIIFEYNSLKRELNINIKGLYIKFEKISNPVGSSLVPFTYLSKENNKFIYQLIKCD